MHATPWALDELALPDIFTMPAEPVAMETESHGIYEAGQSASNDVYDRAQSEADAYARGRADGERAARMHADATVTVAVAALTAAVESVRTHEERWTANAEENIAALAVVVARHLVQREVEADAMIVRDLVQRALSNFPIDQLITVRLHPDDVAACGVVLAPDAAGRVRDIRWMPDVHILRGGCLVEGRERIIDGRVDTSLERAYRTIGQVQT